MRNFLVLTLFTVATLTCTGPILAQQPNALPKLSLDQAIATALAQNPLYRESLVTVDADRARVREARAPLGPSVTLSERLQDQDVVAKLATPFGALPFSPHYTDVPLLSATYTLFDGGAAAARLGIASSTLSAAQASGRQARAELLLDVSSAYYDLVASIQGASVADASERVARAHVTLALQRLRAGQVPRAEVLQAQTDLADRRVGKIRAHDAIALDQNRLDAAMDVQLGTTHVPTDGFGGTQKIPDLNILIASAQAQRGDLAAARLAIEAATLAVRAARAQHAPRVNVDASEGNVQPVVMPGFHAQFTVGLTAVWNLFDNGYTNSRVAEAQAAVSQSQLELRRLQSAAELDVRQAYLEVQGAREEVDAALLLVRLANENQRLAEVRYRGGVGTALELRDAELRGDSAHQVLLDAQRALAEHIVTLRFASGLL